MDSENGETVFRLKESVLRPDCFEVFSEPDKQSRYFVKGRAAPLEWENGRFYFDNKKNDEAHESKKTLLDMNGNKLFLKKEEFGSLRKNQYIYDFRNKQIYSLRKKGWLPFTGRDTIFLFKGKEEEGGEKVMELKASGNRKVVEVIEIKTGKVLATIKKKLNLRTIAFLADTYEVSVPTGSDEAFMLMLGVCVDEHYFEKNQ